MVRLQPCLADATLSWLQNVQHVDPAAVIVAKVLEELAGLVLSSMQTENKASISSHLAVLEAAVKHNAVQPQVHHV